MTIIIIAIQGRDVCVYNNYRVYTRDSNFRVFLSLVVVYIITHAALTSQFGPPRER